MAIRHSSIGGLPAPRWRDGGTEAGRRPGTGGRALTRSLGGGGRGRLRRRLSGRRRGRLRGRRLRGRRSLRRRRRGRGALGQGDLATLDGRILVPDLVEAVL